MSPDVYIGVPCYGGKIGEGMVSSLLSASEPEKRLAKTISVLGFSVLTRNFNMLYAQALNRRKSALRDPSCSTTHFCMHHEDIIPERFWLDKMLSLMEKHDADILSVVSPIKDSRGLSSVALDEPLPGAEDRAEWQFRRLTLRELHENFEPTFTHPKLLINTGLMLVKLTEPWCEKLWFDFTDKIVPNPKRPWDMMAVGVSEDWNFSRRAHKLGLKIFSTREISLLHVGQTKYPNSKWGSMETDTADGD